MVIKKPYAFLIKHFRLIHGLLFIMLLYLSIKTFNIYNFFNDYAVNHTYLNQANLADNYVSFIMYLVAIISIVFCFVIYYILSIKDKSNRLYLAGILYYIVLIIFFIYIHSEFVGLEAKSIDVESVRLLRDISLIAFLPQLIFVFLIFGRALGFNIKQFEFKKDLEELEIDVTDSEEVELTLGTDTYKIARFFRKFLRLTKYFMLENKMFVIASSSLIILGLSIFIYTKVNVYQESYNEEDQIQASSLYYSVNESYITNADMNNVVINKNKHYVLVNVNVTNKLSFDNKLNRDTFRLQVNNELIVPTFSVSDKFTDIGIAFEPCDVKAGTSSDYIVIFEVDNENLAKEYLFKIKNYNGNEQNAFYKDIIIKPTDLNDSKDLGTYKLPNKIDFKDSILKNSVLEIDSFEIADKFKEKYTYTLNNQEKEGVYSIIPSETNKGSVIIIKFKSRLNLDDSIFLKNKIKTPSDLYDLYGIIRYRYQGNYINVKLNKINVDFDAQNYSYLEIPKEVENANKIDLILLIRGSKYIINLK